MPDGFLDLSIFGSVYILTGIVWIFSFRKASRFLMDRQIALRSTLTAMFFAAQMMNYPAVGGTTAHLLAGPISAGAGQLR